MENDNGLDLNQHDLLSRIRHEEKASKFARTSNERAAARAELEALRAEFDASGPPTSYEGRHGKRYLVRFEAWTKRGSQPRVAEVRL